MCFAVFSCSLFPQRSVIHTGNYNAAHRTFNKRKKGGKSFVSPYLTPTLFFFASCFFSSSFVPFEESAFEISRPNNPMLAWSRSINADPCTCARLSLLAYTRNFLQKGFKIGGLLTFFLQRRDHNEVLLNIKFPRQ